MIIRVIPVGLLQANCYLLADEETNEAVVVDPGDEADRIWLALKELNARPCAVILTHGHFDHASAAEEFQVPVFMHAADNVYLGEDGLNSLIVPESGRIKPGSASPLSDDQVFMFGSNAIRIIHTPGHTPGSICLHAGNMLFSGDTLFYHAIGRTDLAGGSYDDIIASIRNKLLVLDEGTLVYPGHGPRTTIGAEKKENEFLCA